MAINESSNKHKANNMKATNPNWNLRNIWLFYCHMPKDKIQELVNILPI